MCAPRFASVLIRFINDQWWVVEGIENVGNENAEPTNRYFLNHGRSFATRDEAFAYGLELANALGFDETQVMESHSDSEK